jgi:hypothetical protein
VRRDPRLNADFDRKGLPLVWPPEDKQQKELACVAWLGGQTGKGQKLKLENFYPF